MVRDIAQALDFLHTKGRWASKEPKDNSSGFYFFYIFGHGDSLFFSAGIAHRDLKLENILCEYTDQVSDFQRSGNF